MGVNPIYIETEESLLEAMEEINEYINDPLWAERGKKPILAVDIETYNLDQIESEEESSDVEHTESDSEEEEIEEDDEESPKDKKKKKNKVPRPILRADGQYTGQIRLIQIGLNPIYNPKMPVNNIQFLFDAKALGYEILSKHLKPILERSEHTWS